MEGKKAATVGTRMTRRRRVEDDGVGRRGQRRRRTEREKGRRRGGQA
jgi:hypothetical protein